MLGMLELPWWGYLIVLMIFTQITIFAVTIYLHRCQAHRALELHPIVSHFFRFWLWLTTGMVTKEWAAIHRKHHAKVETEEDPHSPQIKGIRKVLWEGAELYTMATKDKEILERYGAGTPDDWMERRVYVPYSNIGICIMFAINFVLFGFIGVAMWAIQMAWIPFFAAGVVNGIGHYWGYRNFESKDASRNIIPLGVFIGGEELHNNHHAYPTSAKMSAKWWEFDAGWGMIRLLQMFRLASPKRILPTLTTMPNKNCIDTDTLKALITHRFQVLSRYTRDVILPALSEEKKRASDASKAMLVNAKAVLTGDASMMKASQKARLARLLENFHSLRVTYHFKVKLQAIWNRSTASQKELLEALQEWCQQAEATKIESLLLFTRRLKTYVPQEA